MAAPPLARIFNLRKNHGITEWRKHVLVPEGLQSPRAAVKNVEVADSGFKLGHCFAGILRAGRRDKFQFKTKSVLESIFILFSQHRRWRAAGNDSAFLLCGFDDLFPILWCFCR